MKNTTKTAILSAAMAGLLSGSAAMAANTTSNSGAAGTSIQTLADKGTHSCKGQNTCKGQGGCKSGDNGCKGKNSCKGHGGCATDGSKPQ